MTLETLQQYWWIVVSLLAAILVFLMFVQGGQTLLYTVGKTEIERKLIVNALGRKWEFTFTTLVTFGGAFFASFPLFYSTSFGGAYWVWMAILFAFVIQAVSYEYRTKPNNFLGQKTYEMFLLLNGLLGTVLIGTAVGTFFTGSAFSVDKTNLLNLTGGSNAISAWEGPAHGLEAVLNFTNVALGLAVFFLSRVLGSLYFINNIEHNEIMKRANKQLLINSVAFLVFFLYFLVVVLLKDGFAVDPTTGVVSLEPYKYMNNFLAMPLVLVLFLAGVVLVLAGIGITWLKDSRKGIWYAGLGTVLAVWMLFLNAGFNNTAYYPALDTSLTAGSAEWTAFMQSSLTIRNSSSSHYTLTAMSYVSLLVPFVLAYIWYAWKAINNKRIDEKELQDEHHSY
ncbi:MAG: cytochrome d ubiquinol oxidase subunit II [Bacteroidales bacterium]|nr:cytochrome d ubiquinol oxidase subunit II [Bacteroidales bacterium]MDD3664197.1 cytochrome d ubiquinol oxidase subunit II [Bacteroidales bacterium]